MKNKKHIFYPYGQCWCDFKSHTQQNGKVMRIHFEEENKKTWTIIERLPEEIRGIV